MMFFVKATLLLKSQLNLKKDGTFLQALTVCQQSKMNTQWDIWKQC